MNLFRSINGSPPLQTLRSRVWVGARLSSENPPLPQGWSDSLFNRLVVVGDPRISVVPVLEKWVDEGRPVDKRSLQWMVKQMREFRRYAHALQISTWMSDRRFFPLTPADIADRVDLLSKAYGIEHAERYFSNISIKLKACQPYGALLNCYAEARAVEKTEALFHEMKDLNLVTSFSYNILIKLYSITGQHGKVEIVFRDMEDKGILPDNFTHNLLMEAYVIASDVNGIGKLLERTQNNGNWHIYATAAKGYLKAGLEDEGLELLKKSEELIPRKRGRVAYGFLLSVYADNGIKDEVYRLWKACKSSDKTSNSLYMCMISCLLKLDDTESAKAILKEWESNSSFYDFRVPNLLVSYYCKKGLVGRAESLVREAIGRGKKPFVNTWDRLTGAYLQHNQIPEAVEMMKKELLAAVEATAKPSSVNINECLKYFEGQKDTEAMEEFVSLLWRIRPLPREVYHCLVRTFTMAGKSISGLLDMMKQDGIGAYE